MINEIKQNEFARQEYSFLFNRYPDDIQRAIKQSEKKGIEKGIEKGREESFIYLAKSFRDEGFPLDRISQATGLSIDEIKKL